MRYLKIFFGLLFLALIAMDGIVFPLFAKPVRKWSEWTGKSNFTLARLLLGISLILIVGGDVWYWVAVMGNEGIERTGESLSFASGALLVLLFEAHRTCRKVERLSNQCRGGAIPLDLHVEEELYRILRPFFIGIPIVVVVLTSSDYIFARMIAFLALVIPAIAIYVIFHYNQGGKGKIKSAIDDFTKRYLTKPTVALERESA